MAAAWLAVCTLLALFLIPFEVPASFLFQQKKFEKPKRNGSGKDSRASDHRIGVVGDDRSAQKKFLAFISLRIKCRQDLFVLPWTATRLCAPRLLISMS
jgi:hypothetical protein